MNSIRFAAASLVLLFAGFFALPAGAQTVLLVSNTSQVAFEDAVESARISQRFDTGPNRHGYWLGSVRVISRDLEGDAFAASLCRVTDGDQPTGTCTALTAPSSFSAGTLAFSAPMNTWLAKNQRYAVVLTPDDGATITYETTRSDNQAGLNGWNIAGEYRIEDEGSWTEDSRSRSLKIRLDGTAGTTSPNIAPTGVPTISGTAVVGQQLTADVSGISDDNGLDDVEWRYQWFRVDGMDETEITGATSDTYTLVADDGGKQLKVKVRFTDDAGNAEGPLESEAYPQNATVLGPAVVVTGAEGLETTESGGTDSFEVKLATMPSSDVVVTPSSSDTGEGAVSGSLTFTQMNWASAQTLTVTGVDDDEVDGDQRYEVRFAVTSSDDDYNALAVPAVPVTNLDDERLGLTLDTIAGDDTVNIAEKAAGFVISGTTGAVGDAEVTVTVGTEELGATSEADGTWSVDVPPGASYIAGSSVEVTVNAQKSGFVDAAELTRTLAIDLVAPVAPGYTAPASLKVDVAIAQVSPSGGSGIEGYRVAGLPAGLVIDAESGVISGTPSAADADPATATVTVFDAAGNTDEVRVVFPAVAKGEQVLSGFKYTPSTVTLGESAPTLTAPTGAKTELYYSAEPAGVCTVVRATGALALAGAGECVITATAPASDDYNEATATFTVTVRAANAAPTAANGTVTTNEDTAYAFGAGDFNFSDPDSADALASVRITGLNPIRWTVEGCRHRH